MYCNECGAELVTENERDDDVCIHCKPKFRYPDLNPYREVSKIRLWCLTHRVVLQNAGSDRIFAPTCGILNDSLKQRQDREGWLEFDLSEFMCPVSEDCDQDWSVQSDERLHDT